MLLNLALNDKLWAEKKQEWWDSEFSTNAEFFYLNHANHKRGTKRYDFGTLLERESDDDLRLYLLFVTEACK